MAKYMFLFTKPSEESINRFIASQQRCDFSYREIGASREGAPADYTVDHNRIRLGEGAATCARAVEAVKRWEMFNLGWVKLCWPRAPIEEGSVVAVLASHLGFWSLSACRIVYVIDEDGPVRRFGFAYGTLPRHAERGEERFSIEWQKDDDSVWYDILAFSQPNHMLARIGYPIARNLQKRFARMSKEAMFRYVNSRAESLGTIEGIG